MGAHGFKGSEFEVTAVWPPSLLAGGRLGWGGMHKARARELRKNPTEAERVLWQHIRRRQLGGYRFRRQQPLGEYIVDFFCFEKRLVVEIDGGQHSERVSYDTARTASLKSRGFRVLKILRKGSDEDRSRWPSSEHIPSPRWGKVRTGGHLNEAQALSLPNTNGHL